MGRARATPHPLPTMRTALSSARRPFHSRARRLAAHALALATLAAPLAARAQIAFTDRESWRDYAQNKGGAFFLCNNALDQLANGATSIPFIVGNSQVVPCGTATLSGASITNGRIESTTPFTILYPFRSFVFGADFGTLGSDVAYISFYSGGSLIGTITRPISGTSNQFLGGVVFGPKPDRFDLGVQNGSAFFVDNLVTGVPEPSTAILLSGGLLVLAAGAAARRHARRG
jgi:hypothetical protein